MQHTKRYLLVPEEIYQSLASPPPSDGTPIGLVRNRIKQIKNDDGINEAERAIKYEQELKRFNKLTRDEDDQAIIMDLKKLRLLEFLYKDLSSPVAFTSAEPLLREARKTQPKINRADVQNYLATQRTYTLHRQAKRRYRRLPTLAPGLHTEWQADLAIFDRLAKQNRGYKYLLVCIDTLSRQVFVEPVKTKTSANMIIAFEHIFKRSKYIPWKVLTDQGKEFTARAVQHFFRAKDVEHFCMLTSPQFHAGMAERANRSIKERLYRYFTERNTYTWIDVVQDIVLAINHSPNSSIGMRPADVNFKNAEALRQKLHNAAENVVRRQPRYRVGDRVRIEKYKHVFQKGYLPRFTNELFTVAEVHTERSPVVYRLRDDHNEIISGWFYANDLCKTLEDKQQKMYEIEKVLKRKKQNGVDYAFVKWEGYSARFNRNRTNSFRVRLPRKLQFNSEWEVGLAVIVYPHSWPSIGTVEQQFVQVEWQTGNTVRIEVPPSNVTNPHELSKNLYRLLGEGSDPLAKKARRWAREEYIKRKTKEKRGVRDEELLLQALLTDTGTLVELNSVTHGLLAREKRAESSNVPLRIPADDDDSYQKKLDEYFSKLSDKNLTVLDELCMTKLNAEIKNLTEEERALLEATKEMGTEAWIQAYREIRLVCQFNYDVHRNRFVLNTDPRYVKKVEVSPQLAYILGFNNTEFMQAENEARFMPDMSGGVSSFHVYTPDLIEPMMIGDVTAPVLRIVTIRGNPDQVIEEQFFAIQYHKILLKEVSEILIEVRTNSGSLMPFQYGTYQIPAGAIAKFPHCMVVNLDPSTSRGSHWVCIYCASPLRLEYYDSLGMWPPLSVNIVDHLSRYKQIQYNSLPLQSANSMDWSAFSSDCVQYGGYNIYRGLPYQRGAGVGAVFRSLMRYLLPIGKQIGSAIGRQGMESGNRVLTNVLEGKDLKESLVSESKAGLKNLLEKAANNINTQKGQVPPTNVSVVRSFFRQVLPLATITQESPYLFRLYSDNLWTDLSRIYLYLELSIEKPGANDKWVTIDDADTSVSAIQGIGQTFVQQLKVTVGNTEVYDSGNLYPFKAYITNELSFPINAKKNLLGSTGYYHTVNQDDSTDEGFKERSFHGDYKLSPFMFEPYDLREISIHASGVVYPAVPYKLNFSKDHFVSAFVDMYEALGMANSERSFDISMAQFKKGWTFFVIPLTSTLDDSCGFELLRSGTTNVRATFNSPIPLGGVEMIVLGEFDQMLMVDYNRHIVTDSKLG
ncbi:hypothetical protein niasHT_002441 [Heterodera trifolii]|uniref:Integrase catalytic domain-containing protein n=1 Tax=Heterodera trifolii TaxID=157864 RepID=A0ABD2LMA1_9BILA